MATKATLKLTPKQDHYAMLIAVERYNQSDAYREAYDAENMKDTTIYAESSRLAADDRITARIHYLRQSIEDKQTISALSDRENSLQILRKAAKGGDVTPIQLKGAELLAKTTGLFDGAGDGMDNANRSSAEVLDELLAKLPGLSGDAPIATIDQPIDSPVLLLLPPPAITSPEPTTEPTPQPWD
jgi:hypothetical protein